MIYKAKSLIILSIIFTVVSISSATDESSKLYKTTKQQPKKVWASYCGLYSVYSAIRLNGKPIDYTNIIKPDYCGNSKGSTISELAKAAKDNKMFTKTLTNMTSLELRHCPHPTILHVKRENTSEYNHYELFIGMENGLAKLYNPPNPIKLIPFCELESRWDGIGLIVSNVPINIDKILFPARVRFIILAAATIIIILVIRSISKKTLKNSPPKTKISILIISAIQTSAIFLLAIVFGMLFHLSCDSGLLVGKNGTTSIQDAHIGNFIPKVNKNKIKKLFNQNVIFIDARYPRDFQKGHLEKAVNIPVDTNEIELRNATSKISKDKQIIVYCQSNRCPFAEKVARKLKNNGFSNISIFKGGWNEWKEKK